MPRCETEGPYAYRDLEECLALILRSTTIQISAALDSLVLGDDIEFHCLDEWKRTGVIPSSRALVFPLHGGLPGKVDETEDALFAHELAKLVMPESSLRRPNPHTDG